MLYSDHVSIESHRAAFLMTRFAMQVRTARTRLETFLGDAPVFTEDEIHQGLRDGSIFTTPNVTEEKLVEALTGPPSAIFDMFDATRELARRELESPQGVEFDNAAMFRSFSQVAATRWVEFKPDARPQSAVAAMKELNHLYDLGLVTIDPGDLSQLWIADEDALNRVTNCILTRVIELALARGAYPLLTVDEAADKDDAAIRLSNRAKLAGVVLGSLPNLQHLPTDELLDVRESLASHVARFRAAIADLESGLDNAPGDFAQRVSEIRLRSIDPEIEALNETLQADGLLPTLARGVPLTAGGAIGLAISAAVGGPVLAGAALVSAGLASAVAQEYLRRRTASVERSKNRFFFVWKAQQKLGRAK